MRYVCSDKISEGTRIYKMDIESKFEEDTSNRALCNCGLFRGRPASHSFSTSKVVVISQGHDRVLSDTHLVAFQSLLTSESRVAGTVTRVSVGFLVAPKVMLPVEREDAHIALIRALKRHRHYAIAGR